LPFKKTAYGSITGTPVFIKGTSGIEEKFKQKLADYQIPVSEIEKKENAIIFYESDSFPWKRIIAEIGRESGRHLYYFHGAGTHAIIGSHSGADQGEVIVL
jgi:uncharacterized protein (UPF0248 family)